MLSQELPETVHLSECDLCGVPSRDARQLFVKYGYPVIQCPNCMLLYVNPRARTDILWQRYSQSYFENEYLPTHPALSPTYNEQVNLQIHDMHLRALREFFPERGRLLDIGCAVGLFLAAARSDGWNVVGNELSEFAADYARTRLNLDVLAGNIQEIDFAPGSFDAVTMWETIEHLLSPRRTLERVAKWIRPGGVLAISTPNIGGIAYFLLGRRWFIVAPNEHLFYFSPHTLERLLDETGFETRRMWTEGADLYYIRNILLGREVLPAHIRLAPQTTSNQIGRNGTSNRLNDWITNVWINLRHVLRRKLVPEIHRKRWGDQLIVYAVRRAEDRTGEKSTYPISG